MQEYRKTIEHGPDTKYAWVQLGPIPRMNGLPTPSWHEQSKPSSYPFPTDAAAVRFAENNKDEWPDREVSVVFLGGQIVRIGG